LAGGDWTVYHGDPAGAGAVVGVRSVDTSARAWTSPGLDGQVYGEPLVFASDVYVATENDTVYALSSATGTVVWSHHLGPAAPRSALPCGDISPTVGVTGTPVIDSSRHEVFVVADELVGIAPRHYLFGLDTYSGAVRLTTPVDPPASDPAALLQRTGLTLDGGSVVFGMGGNYGDCGSYRGRVVSVPEGGGTPRFFTVDSGPGQAQGAIWMGGAAPTVDGLGNIWVAAGNGSVGSGATAYDDSDSALELSAALKLLQYFAPADWQSDNATDLDMSTAPAVLRDGQVLVAGKSRIAYLLDAGHLGGIGGQEGEVPLPCGDDIAGGAAVSGSTVYLPCLTGPVALTVSASPPRLSTVWRAGVGGGPPILAAGLVWTIGQNGTLYGLDSQTGSDRQSAYLGAEVNHFPTPAIGDGLLVAPTATGVVAFRILSSSAGSPTAAGAGSTSSGRAGSSTAPAGSSTAPAGSSTAPAGSSTTVPSASAAQGSLRGRSHSVVQVWGSLGLALVLALAAAGLVLTKRKGR
jgi:outer membrane protein assembly factor BamB